MNRKQLVIFILVLIGAMCIHIFLSGGSEGFRPKYDIAMSWLNFGILAFLIVKFGKDPLMNFLKGRKEELSKAINELEQEKKKATDQIQETLQLVEQGDEHIEKIRQRITEQGENEKEKIIQGARYQSEQMIKESKKKISSHILTAKESFRSDLIDAAIRVAMTRLPEEINDNDNNLLLNSFLTEIKQG